MDLGDRLCGGFRAVDLMADQGEVVAGFDGELHILATTVAIRDGSHVEVVGEDEMMIESELATQEAGDDPLRKRGGELRVDVRKLDVGEHDRIQFRHQRGVGQDVLTKQFREGGIGRRQVVMGIDSARPQAGKCFPQVRTERFRCQRFHMPAWSITL